MLAAVNGPRDEEHARAFGDGLRPDVGVACSLADGDGDCGVEAQSLVYDGVEDGQGFDLGVCGSFG